MYTTVQLDKTYFSNIKENTCNKYLIYIINWKQIPKFLSFETEFSNVLVINISTNHRLTIIIFRFSLKAIFIQVNDRM